MFDGSSENLVMLQSGSSSQDVGGDDRDSDEASDEASDDDSDWDEPELSGELASVPA